MALSIEISPAQKQQIEAEAKRVGVSAEEKVKRAIEARFPLANGGTNGASDGDVILAAQTLSLGLQPEETT